jgi:hypothetical protein
MLRLRAIRALLVEEVGGLRSTAAAGETPEAAAGREREGLARAARRALFFVVLDLAAVAALFALREPAQAFLRPGATEEGIFTLGVLVVVAHAGYRFAQYRHLRTLARLHAELGEREGQTSP